MLSLVELCEFLFFGSFLVDISSMFLLGRFLVDFGIYIT